MSELIDKFPMFDKNIQRFTDCGMQSNCEGFYEGLIYYELLEENRTQTNLDLYLKDDNKYHLFFDEKLLMPLGEIDTNALNKVHIFAHTKDFWVTLDPAGVFPVLHPKNLSDIFGDTLPEPHPDVILFPDKYQKLTKPTDVELLEITGTVTFQIKKLVYAMDKTTKKHLTDKEKLTWVDINALALKATRNLGDPYDNGPDGGANYSVDVELKKKILYGVI
jgi:hypothetical protein